MIKINLLGEESVADRGAQLQVATYIGSLLTTLLVAYFVRSSIATTVEEMTEKQRKLKADLVKIQKVTAEVKDYEAKRDDYQNKLIVIAKLKRNKTGPVRVMDDLNIALPEKSWVTEINEDNGIVKITGKALDNQTISAFFRELDKSDYFGEPKNEIIKLSEHEQVKIREFSFETDVFYSGKIALEENVESQGEGQSTQSLLNLDQINFARNMNDDNMLN